MLEEKIEYVKTGKFRRELETLIEAHMAAAIKNGSHPNSRFSDGVAAGLGMAWKALYSDAGFSLREWNDMEGLPDVLWEGKEK